MTISGGIPYLNDLLIGHVGIVGVSVPPSVTRITQIGDTRIIQTGEDRITQ